MVTHSIKLAPFLHVFVKNILIAIFATFSEPKAVDIRSRHTGNSSCLRPSHFLILFMLFCILGTKTDLEMT